MESLGDAYTVALLSILGIAAGLIGVGVFVGWLIWG